MSKRKTNSSERYSEKRGIDDWSDFLDREEERDKNNKLKNKPIVIVTYMMVLVFIGMFGYIIYFVAHDAEKVVANTSNRRQDSYSKYVVRGDIETSDGVVVAHTEVDEEGNETRVYPEGAAFAHVIGYNEYGRSGMELTYNFELLRSHANVMDKIRNDVKEGKNPGDTVVSTIDYDVQRAAAAALGGANGAVVAIEPDTGKVLAMYSNPAFDPNDMENVWNSVHEEGSTSTVLLNRATQGLYAPGSTFKVLTTLEYIKEHPDYENYSYTCNGTDIFNGVSIRCSNNHVHGTQDLKGSLANSCNTSFCNIGCNDLNIGGLNTLCNDMLFNDDLPLDMDYSRSSYTLDTGSDSGEIPQTVIGQGNTLITPIHNALIMATIANGGVMMKPMFVEEIDNSDGAVVKTFKPKSSGTKLDSQLTSAIIPMLQEVCTSGTASSVMAGKPYSVAGKTGTAEYDNNGNTNSWFVGFSNVEDPDVVVSVIVEDYTTNGISGASVAGQVFDAYYNTREASQ